MGRAVRECLAEVSDVELRACVAPSAEGRSEPGGTRGAPLWLTPEALAAPAARAPLPADLVILDVSAAPGTSRLAALLSDWPRALVVAATGFDAATDARIDALAGSAPVLKAPNLSLGIAVVEAFLRSLPPAARAAYETDIIEHHHAGKRDAPSGTALCLAKALRASGPSPAGGEARVHSIRAGSVPGIHRVLFSGAGETLEIVHTVFDRALFARGAIQAVRFLHDKPPGRYTAQDLLRQT